MLTAATHLLSGSPVHQICSSKLPIGARGFQLPWLINILPVHELGATSKANPLAVWHLVSRLAIPVVPALDLDACLLGCSFAYFVCLLSKCLRRVTELRRCLPPRPALQRPESYPLRGVYYEHWRKSPSSKPYLSWEKSIKRSQAAMAHACYFQPDDPAFLIMKLLPGD